MNLLAATLLASAALGSTPQPANLDFRSGDLTGWQGRGFYLTTANPRGAALALGVCSSDARSPARTGLLRYVFRVPEGAGRIRFHAYAAYGREVSPQRQLDVVLAGEGKRVVPKYVRTPSGWASATMLLPRKDGRAREYCWDVSGLVGTTLQIVILDNDPRPGCHVFCGGFRLEAADDSERREFARFMLALERDRDLPAVAAYESKHFLAWGNAEEGFIAERLRNCEALHAQFFDYFRDKGFTLRPPTAKLMIAVFDAQLGFEAYLGQKMPAGVIGMYHRTTNRFVVYDLHKNQALADGRKKLLQQGRNIPIDLDRQQHAVAVERHIRGIGNDLNVSTTVHEVAHQLSFNSGLLNRQGDAPLWLVEGLACYCEGTEQGSWQGIGAISPERVRQLAAQLDKVGKLLPLRTLVNDGWFRDAAGLGYAQSWALFRMLIEEEPEALRAYLKLIYPRRAPEHRLTDFLQAFGADLAALERRHRAYVRALIDRHGGRDRR